MKQTAEIRITKYRNLIGHPWKTKFAELQISARTVESWGIAANPLYVTYIREAIGGGPINVLDVNDQVRRPPELRISAHSTPTQDIKFSPFDDSIICSSADASIKVWRIPPKSEWTEALTQPVVELMAQGKRTCGIEWNPVADSILASGAGDGLVSVWDLSRNEPVLTIPHNDYVPCVAWNINGTHLVTTCRDNSLRIIDPRVSSKYITKEVNAYEGKKSSKVLWADGTCGDPNRIITTGFSKMGDRSVSVWDTRQFEKALHSKDIDRRSSFLLLYWDESCGLLYVVGKGETTIRVFMFDDCGNLKPLNQFKSAFPFMSLCFTPKRGVDVLRTEIQRAYLADQIGITPLSFTVTRKITNIFHDDLYQHCLKGVPSMTAAEWLSGEIREPRRLSLDPTMDKKIFDDSIKIQTTELESLDKNDLKDNITVGDIPDAFAPTEVTTKPADASIIPVKDTPKLPSNKLTSTPLSNGAFSSIDKSERKVIAYKKVEPKEFAITSVQDEHEGDANIKSPPKQPYRDEAADMELLAQKESFTQIAKTPEQIKSLGSFIQKEQMKLMKSTYVGVEGQRTTMTGIKTR